MGWSVAQRFGLTFHRPQLSTKGYTLFTPAGGDSSYLVDLDGRFVHRWQFDDVRPHTSRLLPGGNLLMLGVERSLLPPPPDDPVAEPPPLDRHVLRLGAACSILREVTWDGELVREHRITGIHHDCVALPNGHRVFPVWVEMPEDAARAVRGGRRRPREKLPPLLGDDIVEIDERGAEVRRIETWRLFDPRKDPICDLERRWEWTHVNSVDVNARGDVLISCRQNSRVAVIDPAGAMTWKYGFPDTAHQHHATWLRDGHVQIFDNGMHRVGMSTSRIVEVDPATNAVVWQYEGDPPEQFFSGHISGAERLRGGNVLICEGTSGRLLEVTSRGEPAWEWWNPVYNPRPNGTRVGWVFRAYRYAPDDPAVRDRDLDPRRLADLNRLYGLA